MSRLALDFFAAAAADSSIGLEQARRLGKPIVRTLGVDAPVELIIAAGTQPIRLVAPPGMPTPRSDRTLGSTSMGLRGKRLLEQLIDGSPESVLLTHADALQPQLYAALRELGRIGESVPENVHFLDLLHLNRESSRRYNEKRLADLTEWLAEIGGHTPGADDIEAAIATIRRQRELISRAGLLRSARRPTLTGAQMLNIVGAAAALPPEAHAEHLELLLASADELPVADGARVFVCGTAHEHAGYYQAIEAAGALIVGEDHDWGERFQADVPERGDDLANPMFRRVARTLAPNDCARRVVREASRCGAERIVHLSIGEDEAAPWDLAAIRRSGEIPVHSLSIEMDGSEDLRAQIAELLRGDAPKTVSGLSPGTSRSSAGKPAAARGERSRKSLQSLASFGTYQREWFASVRADVAAGAPFAVVNANAPQEILRAMGIPFVVNQWWASIVAAKQQSGRYAQLLRERGFPTKVEAYSAQGLAGAFDDDAEQAPWGGLPKPDFVHAVASSDPTLKIFDEWADAAGADCFVYERTVDPRWSISSRWWEELPDRWDQALEPERIDLLVEEIRSVIARLERKTGRHFSQERFETVMGLVNEQEHYYRRTRDLIARSFPVPISIVDSMPATMVPQWHRGTEWARDAAKAFYEEVKERVDSGLAAAPNERVRLMWVGRGLWSDMGFYQKWEESHGAVFVWSMYLGLAADGYIRNFDRGRDPLRALAARFITMGDELRMPTWAGPWHVHEAQTHSVDAAIALRDADPFVVRALRAAGVPVLELPVDNFAREGEDASLIEASITEFIEGPATERAEARCVTA